MIEVMAEDPLPLQMYADTVNAAYAAAQAASWDARARAGLWEAAVAAVLAYASRPRAAAEATRFYLLLVDLAADSESLVVAAWPENQQRAVRVAATRTLACATKPHHRPRAQSLLKRLDTLAEPALQAREQVLLAISRQRQTLHRQQLRSTARVISEQRPLSASTLDSRAALLDRLNEVVRGLPRAPLLGRAGPTFVGIMQELQALVESDQLFTATSLVILFELMQRAMAPAISNLGLGPAIAALEAIRGQMHPGVQATRVALTAMVFDLELAEVSGDRRDYLHSYLKDVAHIATHLMDIPSVSLPALLFRLKQRLSDPGNDFMELPIDVAIATIERLEQSRVEAAALVSQCEGATEDDGRLALLNARRHQRELDMLLISMQGLCLAGVGAADVRGVLALMHQVTALAGRHGLDGQAFEQLCGALSRQLERPSLTRDRVWQAATVALGQLSAHRHVVEETLRGLAFDRHLVGVQKAARQTQLEFQAKAFDQAHWLLASLPLEGLSTDHEQRALWAIAELTQAMRRVASGQDPFGLRSAMDDVVASLSPMRT
jgi:hypothetical protein